MSSIHQTYNHGKKLWGSRLIANFVMVSGCMKNPIISSELKLCCLLSHPELTSIQVSESNVLINLVDMKQLEVLINQHRIWPCVYLNIIKHFPNLFPKALLDYLSKKYQKNVHQNHQQLITLGRVLHIFKVANIHAMPIKGVTIAQKYYKDIAKRHGVDIDIIICPDDFYKAHELLLKNEFTSNYFSQLKSHLKKIYLSMYKDVTYIANNGMILELHIRLQNQSGLLSQKYSAALYHRNMSENEYFIYLCYHSARTLHHRLKWLCDIVLMIEQCAFSWENLYAKAISVDAVRCITINLILTETLFKIKLPATASKYFKQDRPTLMLANCSLKNLDQPIRSETFSYNMQILRCNLKLVQRMKSKLLILQSLLKPNKHDINCLPNIPKKLSLIYYFLRPVLLINRILKTK